MLILEWKESAGADGDFPERICFDVDHLTKKAVRKIECSKVCFPGVEPLIWRVRCLLKKDDDGHRIKVRYAEGDQCDSFWRRFPNRDGYTGETTIFVKRNESGKAEKTGRFKWVSDSNGESEGRWWAVDGP